MPSTPSGPREPDLARKRRHASFLRMLAELNDRHLVGVSDVRELWLIRHADAYGGLEDLSDGLIDPPLSPRGVAEAGVLARRLAGVRIDAVWSSQLRRARQTADLIAGGRGLPVLVDERLREVRTFWDEGRDDQLPAPGVYPFPEPEAEVAARMGAALADIARRLGDVDPDPPPPRAAVVSHNAAIGVAVSSALGLAWGQLRLLLRFTSVSVLAVKGERVVVQSIADATHLAELAI